MAFRELIEVSADASLQDTPPRVLLYSTIIESVGKYLGNLSIMTIKK